MRDKLSRKLKEADQQNKTIAHLELLINNLEQAERQARDECNDGRKVCSEQERSISLLKEDLAKKMEENDALVNDNEELTEGFNQLLNEKKALQQKVI